jgi:hypothetical protein
VGGGWVIHAPTGASESPGGVFTDDRSANIVAVGQWHNDVTGVQELVDLHAHGTLPATAMLTASWNIPPSQITAASGPQTIEQTVFLPLRTMENAGTVRLTDFTTLVNVWRTQFGVKAHLYEP